MEEGRGGEHDLGVLEADAGKDARTLKSFFGWSREDVRVVPSRRDRILMGGEPLHKTKEQKKKR